LPLNNASVVRSPYQRVLVNGRAMVGAIESEVISNNYYAADRFSILVALGPDPWANAPFWAAETDIRVEVQFSLDGGASFTSLVQGAVDHIVLDGRDLAASLIEARTQETFANRTSSEIATILAGRHGLTSRVVATTTPVGRYYQSERDTLTLNQFSPTTEWDLLVLLARQEGYDIFVHGDTLYFQPSSGQTDIALSLRPSDVIDLKLERSLGLARDIQVIVKSWNTRLNAACTQQAKASARKSGGAMAGQAQSYVYIQPNLTPSDALKLAQQRLAELMRHERTVEIIMPGELALTPRSMIALEGTGTDFDQVYFVDVIERKLRFDRGMTQRLRAKNTSPRIDSAIPSTSGGSIAY
jgi:phage protein D